MDRIEYTFTLHNGSIITERLSLPDAHKRLAYIEARLCKDAEMAPTDYGPVHRNYLSEAEALRVALDDHRGAAWSAAAARCGMTFAQYKWLRENKQPLSQSLGNYAENFALEFNLDDQTAGKLVIKFIAEDVARRGFA